MSESEQSELTSSVPSSSLAARARKRLKGVRFAYGGGILISFPKGRYRKSFEEDPLASERGLSLPSFAGELEKDWPTTALAFPSHQKLGKALSAFRRFPRQEYNDYREYVSASAQQQPAQEMNRQTQRLKVVRFVKLTTEAAVAQLQRELWQDFVVGRAPLPPAFRRWTRDAAVEHPDMRKLRAFWDPVEPEDALSRGRGVEGGSVLGSNCPSKRARSARSPDLPGGKRQKTGSNPNAVAGAKSAGAGSALFSCAAPPNTKQQQIRAEYGQAWQEHDTSQDQAAMRMQLDALEAQKLVDALHSASLGSEGQAVKGRGDSSEADDDDEEEEEEGGSRDGIAGSAAAIADRSLSRQSSGDVQHGVAADAHAPSPTESGPAKKVKPRDQFGRFKPERRRRSSTGTKGKTPAPSAGQHPNDAQCGLPQQQHHSSAAADNLSELSTGSADACMRFTSSEQVETASTQNRSQSTLQSLDPEPEQLRVGMQQQQSLQPMPVPYPSQPAAAAAVGPQLASPVQMALVSTIWGWFSKAWIGGSES